jgi:hypothetical protein
MATQGLFEWFETADYAEQPQSHIYEEMIPELRREIARKALKEKRRKWFGESTGLLWEPVLYRNRRGTNL